MLTDSRSEPYAEPCADATDRRAVPPNAVLWQSTHGEGLGGEAKDEEPTYSEALEVYNTDRQELERLRKERVTMEQQFETAKNKLRAVEAKRQAVGKEDYQRLKELDPDQAREYLEQRETKDAEVARQVKEDIGKLTAQHAEDMEQLQAKIVRQEERVRQAWAVLDKAEAARAE